MDGHAGWIENPAYTANTRHPDIGNSPYDSTMVDQDSQHLTYQGAKPKQYPINHNRYGQERVHTQTPSTFGQFPRFSTPTDSLPPIPPSFPQPPPYFNINKLSTEIPKTNLKLSHAQKTPTQTQNTTQQLCKLENPSEPQASGYANSQITQVCSQIINSMQEVKNQMDFLTKKFENLEKTSKQTIIEEVTKQIKPLQTQVLNALTERDHNFEEQIEHRLHNIEQNMVNSKSQVGSI